MPTITPTRLIQLGARVFRAHGVPAGDAKIISNSLVESNLTGHDSHGIIRLPSYVAKLIKGEIHPLAKLDVVHETSNAVLFDGNWGFGQVMARRAVESAIDRAANSGIYAATLRKADHIGRVGEYSVIAAEHGYIGIVMANGHGSGQLVVPHGGTKARLATTPLSICVPNGTAAPILLDFATSVVAEGKIKVALNRGEELSDGLVIDSEGNPTTDPKDLYGPPWGALLPFGGYASHKGFALGFMIELIAGLLSGAGTSHQDPGRFGNATFICLIKIDAFLPLEEFYLQAQTFSNYVKTSPLQPGFTEILIPGEPEARARHRRLREGIYLADDTWNSILETAREAGVDP